MMVVVVGVVGVFVKDNLVWCGSGRGGLVGIFVGPLEIGAAIFVFFDGALEERSIEVGPGSAEE